MFQTHFSKQQAGVGLGHGRHRARVGNADGMQDVHDYVDGKGAALDVAAAHTTKLSLFWRLLVDGPKLFQQQLDQVGRFAQFQAS